jgi:hypothetical protein
MSIEGYLEDILDEVQRRVGAFECQEDSLSMKSADFGESVIITVRFHEKIGDRERWPSMDFKVPIDKIKLTDAAFFHIMSDSQYKKIVNGVKLKLGVPLE